MMTRSVKQAICSGITAIVTTMLALALTTGAAEAACAQSIKKCGCTISAPGTYTMVEGVGFETPATGTCIDITASNVTLKPKDPTFLFAGPGSNTPTFGIHIEASANNVTVEYLEPVGFGQGIQVDGGNATIFAVETSHNNKASSSTAQTHFLSTHIQNLTEPLGFKSMRQRRTS
jgi:hypothetical protein